ncbi:peroxide stress protein YaaA [uncultured Limosilactobacillus sp.]|uniref:peroxide stress protein YaaA n=1 Tax=uncultured Limosilactobacillus sp. TaxID=2837629 RepID=UPI00344F4182
MQIIIAPARKMTTDTDSLPVGQLPRFLPFTRQILKAMQQLSYQQARKLWWNCSERIARPNYRWLFELELTKQLTPALLAFTGLQYQYMGAGCLY